MSKKIWQKIMTQFMTIILLLNVFITTPLNVIQATRVNGTNNGHGYHSAWLTDQNAKEVNPPADVADGSHSEYEPIPNNILHQTANSQTYNYQPDPASDRYTFMIIDISRKDKTGHIQREKTFLDEANAHGAKLPASYLTFSTVTGNNKTVYVRWVNRENGQEISNMTLQNGEQPKGFEGLNKYLKQSKEKIQLDFNYENQEYVNGKNIINVQSVGTLPLQSFIVWNALNTDVNGILQTTYNATIPGNVDGHTQYRLANVDSPSFDLNNPAKYNADYASQAEIDANNKKQQYDQGRLTFEKNEEKKYVDNYKGKLLTLGHYTAMIGQRFTPMKERTFKGYELFKSENKSYQIYDSYKVGETRIAQSYKNYGVKTMLKVEDITGRGKLQVWVMNPFTQLVNKNGKLYFKDQKASDLALAGNTTDGFVKVFETAVLGPKEWNTKFNEKASVPFKMYSDWVESPVNSYPIMYNGQKWQYTAQPANNVSNADNGSGNPAAFLIKRDSQFVIYKTPGNVSHGFDGLPSGGLGYLSAVAAPYDINISNGHKHDRIGHKTVYLINPLERNHDSVYWYVPQGKVITKYVDENGNPLPGIKSQVVMENQNGGTDYDASTPQFQPKQFVINGEVYELIPTQVDYQTQKLKDINQPAGEPTKAVDGVSKEKGKVIAATKQIITYHYKKKGPLNKSLKVTKKVIEVTNKDGKKYDDGKMHQAGDKIFYQLQIKNTGNVDITSVTLNDVLLNVKDVVVNNVNIAPGGTYDYDFANPYIVTQADMNKGKVENVAKVKGKTPGGDTPDTPSNKTETNGEQKKDMTIKKTVRQVTNKDGKKYDDGKMHTPGDKIYYALDVTNTGNVTINNLKLNDKLLDLQDVMLNDVNIEPGKTYHYDFDKTYTVTQNDLNAGKVTNVVKAIGTTPAGDTPEKESDVDTPTNKQPDMQIKKSVTKITDKKDKEYKGKQAGKLHAVGDKVYYQVKITNTGNLTITSVTLNDALLGINNTNVKLTIEPGKNKTYTFKTPYSVTQKDLNAGKVKNVVTAVGKTPGGDTPNRESHVDTPTDYKPDMQIKKSVTKITDKDGKEYKDKQAGKLHAVGDKVYYQVKVTNTGNVKITELTINDKLLGITNEVVKNLDIEPGKTYTHEFTAPYSVTQKDLDSKDNLVNTVKVSGKTPGGDIPEKPDKTKTQTDKEKSMDVTKAVTKITDKADKEYTGKQAGKLHAVGDKVYYEVTIKNTGNQTITGLT
ncbi:DUF7507 domain-containing protein, partial [Ligilactobacillus ceti]|uniref:DUF7507 domain-containing protein n=1 Tax=Ligilactobacillus ceti TaxID=395085 RepID=UPI000485C5F8